MYHVHRTHKTDNTAPWYNMHTEDSLRQLNAVIFLSCIDISSRLPFYLFICLFI
jgi:hypothetical protein